MGTVESGRYDSIWCDAQLSDSESQRLFSSDRFDVQIFITSERQHSSLEIRDKASLENFFTNEYAERGPQTFFFLSQRHSWDRLSISRAAFEKLISVCSVAPEFFSFVRSFGSKNKDTDSNFNGYFRRIYKVENTSNQISFSAHEFCFSIRYPELHGRDAEEPWVIRQLLVHQKYDVQSNSLTWIILQCPLYLRRILTDAASTDTRATLSEDTLKLHMIILNYTMKNWRDYVNHLETVVEDLDEKACFSRVGQTHQFDYPTSFRDAQLLQQYYRMILKARQAIDSSLDIIAGLSAHTSQLASLNLCPENLVTKLAIERYVQYMQIHRRSITTLAEYSRGTNNLLLKILGYRNDETVHRHGELVHHENEVLQRLTLSARSEAEGTRTLLQASAKDSKALKSLTFVATIYLPANLVAAIFNSNLVTFGPASSDTRGEQLMVSKGVWLYILASVLLTALTIITAVQWENICAVTVRRWKMHRARP